jgi:hypothetical protein
VEWFVDEKAAAIPVLKGNSVFGVGPKIAEWAPYPGSAPVCAYETIKVK